MAISSLCDLLFIFFLLDLHTFVFVQVFKSSLFSYLACFHHKNLITLHNGFHSTFFVLHYFSLTRAPKFMAISSLCDLLFIFFLLDLHTFVFVQVFKSSLFSYLACFHHKNLITLHNGFYSMSNSYSNFLLCNFVQSCLN